MVADAATAQFLESVDNHTLRFKESYGVTPSHKLVAKLKLTHIDFTKVPAGQGLYAPGHFLIDSKLETQGQVSLTIGDLPAGARANLTLVTTTTVSAAKILKVKGIVDPNINIEGASFDINDIPDFLNDPANHLDIENPQIYITITNASPLSIELNGMLSSYNKGSETASIGIGRNYGTAPIIVRGNSTTEFVVCRKAVGGSANDIVVPDLNKLIETIPDRFSFHSATSEAIREVNEYTLGAEYTYNCDYSAVIPLAFGDAMVLHYTHEETDCDSDLDKYNFDTVEVSADVINCVPLDMTPTAVALDHNSNELTTVTVDVDGTVTAGSLTKPSTSKLVITIRSTGKNISGLDGVRLLFDATSNSAFVGENLNDQQTLKFENIRITVKGGVIVDLND